MGLNPASIRARLTLWYAASLAAILVLVSSGTYLLLRVQLEHQTNERLEERAAALVNLIQANRDTRSLYREIEDLEDNEILPLFRVLRNNDRFYRSNDWARAGLDTTLLATTSDSTWVWESADGVRYFLQTITGVHNRSRSEFQVAVAEDGEAVLVILQNLTRMLVAVIILSLILASTGGYLLAGRFLLPVGVMASKTEEITARRLTERLPVQDPRDEFGRLATVINLMLTRLQSSFEQLRRFTTDASHTLRTPLTAIRSVGEVGLQKCTDLKSCREVISSMLEETESLTALVDDLLSLARAEAGLTRSTREVVDLSELAEEVAGSLRILAEEKRQELIVDAGTQVAGLLDRSMVRHALLNLVDNAIRYTAEEGRIDIEVREQPDGFGVIEVRDTGRGIPLEEQERIFERFHKVGKEPASESAGSGLGLAIARWAVHLNEGWIDLESEPGTGSAFRIVLPLATDAGPAHEEVNGG
ncbi:sensor histidine kinase [Gemmatimonadota bacterium]